MLDPACTDRLRASFALQGAMRAFGATLDAVEPGRVRTISVADGRAWPLDGTVAGEPVLVAT